MPSMRLLAVSLSALAVLAGCSSEDAGSEAESSSPSATSPSAPPGKPVATALGFGPVLVGMTLTEATAALAETQYEQTHADPYPCTVLSGPTAGTVYVADQSGRVIGIETPAGTLTDRGIGDGSTPDQLRAEYEGDHAIAAGPFDGFIVQPIGTSNPLEFLSFAVDDGRLGPPYVGRNYWDDDCP
ncbi:hypothetical protein [Antrihabitans sp. YC2-6]|uniref:hypothetical protein n=1 Tax=Antrihabitans sp. YC2-6 TaxID=2799498 RepID=UPI0018F6E4C8|nr:hypothetical protein [Antrihabitans sp. YC2-6]MBJ8348326.1 hypothetical protein [Antrihabitans sp. YC2-6]